MLYGCVTMHGHQNIKNKGRWRYWTRSYNQPSNWDSFKLNRKWFPFYTALFRGSILKNKYDGLGTSPSYHRITGSKLRCQTPTKHTTNICEPLRIISVKYSSILPDDGSHTIRNMLEWFLILCILKFIQRRF